MRIVKNDEPVHREEPAEIGPDMELVEGGMFVKKVPRLEPPARTDAELAEEAAWEYR